MVFLINSPFHDVSEICRFLKFFDFFSKLAIFQKIRKTVNFFINAIISNFRRFYGISFFCYPGLTAKRKNPNEFTHVFAGTPRFAITKFANVEERN